jgi:hypothetical protein
MGNMVEGRTDITTPLNKDAPISLEKNQKTWLVVVLTILLVLSLGSTAYLAYQNINLKKQLSQALSPTPTSFPTQENITESPSPTNNVYWNPDDNYKVNYPLDLKFEEIEKLKISRLKPPTVDNTYRYFHRVVATYPPGLEDRAIGAEWEIFILTWDNPDKLDLESWLLYLKDNRACALCERYPIVSNYTVDGLDAFRAWYAGQNTTLDKPGICGQACPILTIYTVNNDLAYMIDLVYYREVDDESQEAFDEMLSSFKFIN